MRESHLRRIVTITVVLLGLLACTWILVGAWSPQLVVENRTADSVRIRLSLVGVGDRPPGGAAEHDLHLASGAHQAFHVDRDRSLNFAIEATGAKLVTAHWAGSTRAGQSVQILINEPGRVDVVTGSP